MDEGFAEFGSHVGNGLGFSWLIVSVAIMMEDVSLRGV